ncbi:MAG TPA: DUF1707 domain-containing protein [Pseudonocardiaceae bacterium]|nr:DUF1707 domain-containing protein [Pseudonocardiaceae bacterium]
MDLMVGVGEEGTLMSSADAMRASDDDRQKVVQALQEQVGAGRLTLPEFEERTDRAYAATTVGELRELTADLPIEVFPQAAPQAQSWQGPFPLPSVPPWGRQQAMPPRQGGRFPVRRVPPLVIAGAVIGVILLLNGVAFALDAGLHLVFPVLPLFIVLFVLFRRGGGGRRYRR